MTITHKRAKVTANLFGFLFFFLTIYFIIVRPSGFVSNHIHYGINAIVFISCFIYYFIYLYKTNKKTNYVDERDLGIQKKSHGISMILTLIYVYSICIVLFIINRDGNVVSVSWLWFIAYSTFAFAYFITSSIILYHYNKE